MKKCSFISLFLLFFLFLPPQLYAFEHPAVLGAETSSANPQLPPTIEGPGLLLPDSPLYFLDKLKQQARLVLAFSPENKALVYTDVAGERLAEARYMLARDKQDLASTAITDMAQNLTMAANSLAEATFAGRDVSKDAETINDSIKRKQDALDLLEMQATGPLKTQVRAAEDTMLAAKLKVEDSLPEGDIENEIQADVERQTTTELQNTTTSLSTLESDLNELQKEASATAEKSLERRQEALQKVMQEKNDAIKQEKAQELSDEIKKQQEAFTLQEEEQAQIKEIIQNAQEAAAKFQKLQDATNKAKSVSIGGSSASLL